MLLRKLVAALCPPLMCLLCCAAFRWLDGLISGFPSFLLKGLLLGLCVALALPAAGIRSHTNGLAGWLLAGAGLLCLTLVYQYLESVGALHWPALLSLLSLNGQAVLVESTVMSYLAVTGLMNRRR